MKVIPQGYGMLRIEAETDADRVWLSGMIEMFPESVNPLLSCFIRIDTQDQYSTSGDNKGRTSDFDIEELLDDEGNPKQKIGDFTQGRLF